MKHCKEHFFFRIGRNVYLDFRFLCHKQLLIFIITLKLCTKPLMHWNHVLELCIKSCGEELTLFRMCFSGFAHGRRPLPTICHTYSTIMKLDTVIPYLEKTQNIYESRDTPFKFCWNQHFFHRISINLAISVNTDIGLILVHHF